MTQTATLEAERESYQILAAAQSLRLAAQTNALPRSVRYTKRCLDVAFVLASGLLAVWLFPLLALLIYLDSPGPIFYRQRRAGVLRFRRSNGRCAFIEFEMIKFRTMRPDAEKYTGAVLASEDDPRVTRIGRFLRKTRLDELPQLWNVLKGDMSLVGPRPERPELFENLALAIPFFEERMRDVRPGITGLAQVSLGYTGRPCPGSQVAAISNALVNPFGLEGAEGALADDMRLKLLFDLAYVTALEKFWTFLLFESRVIVKTPWVMLRGAGR
jgi:lipopolysaccharide/colanic/teichoic acid biosynthesis glycosyltransferase